MQTQLPRKLLSLTLAIVVGLVVVQNRNKNCQAQSTTTVESRDTPAPWRPSFGKVNRDAAQVQNNDDFNLSKPADSAIGISANPSNLPNRTPLADRRPDDRSSEAAETAPALKASPLKKEQDSRFGPSIGPGHTRVTKKLDKLPNSAGQVWRAVSYTHLTLPTKA